ncbi:MAG: DUF4386 family protein [Thermoleophilaceae bacterium]|nr:DUF4386 family protein [Thermoleophilaceae bacterium]
MKLSGEDAAGGREVSTSADGAPEAPLRWEARTGKAAAGAAFLSAGLAAASTAVQIAAIGAPPDNEREALIRFDANRGEFFLSLGLQVLSYFLLAAALFYLLRATVHRRPETPRFAIGLLLLAPVLLAVGGLLNQLDLNDVADKFLASGERTDNRAENLLEDRAIFGGAVGSGGTLCLALSLVLISLNAMRAGLLSRFMGVLGMIVGGLLILPLLPGGQSVVQIFWLVALGALFLDRWPGGRGPAWETGEAVPWPSAAEARGEALASTLSVEHPDPGKPDAEDPGPPHPVSRKRKKKRR